MPVVVDAGVAPSVSVAPLPKPAPVTRSGKAWPFHTWNRAEAMTFNAFDMKPQVQLRAIDDNGWSPHIVERKPLTDTQAKQSVDLVTKTQGDVSVSKCPFPRHAVVLYEDDAPVASINVCFSCGDILLWPRWEPAPDWEKMTDKQRKEQDLKSAKQMKAYEQVFPTWKTFFRDEVGFPIDGTFR
jgi:hypothetical protein